MTFSIVYRQEIKKIVQAIMIDNRLNHEMNGKDGNIVQAKIDAEVAAIGDKPLFYSIESDSGNLCGYFYLRLQDDKASLGKKNYRPQYGKYFDEFDSLVTAFIASNKWKHDYLPPGDLIPEDDNGDINTGE